MKTLLLFLVLAIPLTSFAGGERRIKDEHLERATKKALHIFEATVLNQTKQILHKGKPLTKDELALYNEILNAKPEEITFQALDDKGQVIELEERNVSSNEDPFAEEEEGANSVKISDHVVILKRNNAQFSLFSLEIKETLTFKISKSIKGNYEVGKEYDFHFYRLTPILGVGCPHIAQIGDPKIAKRYFLAKCKDGKHSYAFGTRPIKN